MCYYVPINISLMSNLEYDYKLINELLYILKDYTYT